MNIILLGPPGAGKGTQSRILVDSFDMVQLSTGDMLREAKNSDTEMGERVAGVMARGDLVTDDIVIGLIREKLTEASGGGFIFDGFPRTLPQAAALEELLTDIGAKLDAVIEMGVDDDALVRRITARFTCKNCGEVYNDETKPQPSDGKCINCGGTEFMRRADDNEASLRQRLMEYYKKTSPILGYYFAKGLLFTVNGLDDIKDVHSEIMHVIER